jgi:hypothetical protein
MATRPLALGSTYMLSRRAILAALAVGTTLVAAGAVMSPPPPSSVASIVAADPIRFGRDIRPILSDRCYLCHGPDRAKQKAGLRLDSFEGATAPRKDGAAIVPGHPDESLLLQRIAAVDADTVMPPPDSGKHALSRNEQAMLRQWIAEGALYESHWAFTVPTVPTVPTVHDVAWPRTPIDNFILAALERASIAPNSEADRATLCRRVFLDLTGLPPTPEETASFLTDERADAYEVLVDRLLTQEPYRSRYAERMAIPWLDVARYADTCGIHQDNGRQMWLWRDWVLAAFRDNMPYNQFVVEQVAGDLMPDGTVQQKIASGFNRAHVTSDEGGAIDAEYLMEYAVDRTATVGAAFLGLTLQCARCHDHKFDPVTQEDFYSLLAFFNSNEQPGIYSQTMDANRAYEPSIEVPTPEHAARLSILTQAAADARTARDAMSDTERAAFESFRTQISTEGIHWAALRFISAVSTQKTTLTVQPDGSVLSSGENPSNDEQTFTYRTDATNLRAIALEAMTDPSLPNGRVGRAPNGNAVLDAIEVEAVSVTDPTKRQSVSLAWAWADVEQSDGDYRVANALRRDGRVWAVNAQNEPGSRAALFMAAQPFGFPGGTELRVKLVTKSPYPQHAFGRVRMHAGAASDSLIAELPTASSNWYIVGPFPISDASAGYQTVFGPEKAVPLDLNATFGVKGDGTFKWRYAPGVKEAEPVGLAQGIDAEFVARELWSAAPGSIELSLGSDDGLQVYANGVRIHENKIDRAIASERDHVVVPLVVGSNLLVCKVVNNGSDGGFYHRELPRASDIGRGAVALAMPVDSVRPAVIEAAIESWRAAQSPTYQVRAEAFAAAERERTAFAQTLPRTMVMQERATPVDTFVMKRGLYDQPDETRKVSRRIPAALGALPADAPNDRRGLAEWLVSAQNPLTARVVVNRFWEQFFGRGLVKSSEDFGLQGEWPSHMELLDWLATDFRDHGWDVRRLVKQIVSSQAYRQSSRVRPDVAAHDPEDRMLAWFPRQRLSAEQIRDQALYVGGLLRERLGGPSVKPYQPDGLWQETSMPTSNTKAYDQGTGDDLWRRSLYTYWKRASPPPSMLAFDAPTREFCAVRRFVTNTPLQALVLWNDPQLVEAARASAERTLREPGDDRARIARLWMRVTGRVLDDRELTDISEALTAERARWGSEAGQADARTLLAVGDSPVPADIAPAELASWTMICNALLSSDPVIVKD